MYFKTKNLTILFILFSTFLFSQTVTTKFILSGYLTDKSKTISKCKFKKKKEVVIIDFMGEKWWKVNYNGCIGYVTSPSILITEELVEFGKIKYKKLQIENSRKKDSIKQINDLIEKKRIEDIKLNILDYVKDSLLMVTVKKGSILKQSPEILGEILMTISEDTKVIVLDYLNGGYFKVCINSNCGYMSEVYFDYNWILNSKTNIEFLEEFKKVKEFNIKEQIRKKRLEEIEKEKIVYFKECRFGINEKEELSGLLRKNTIFYDIDKYGIQNGELKIQLQRYGSLKYIRIKSSHDLGCTSSNDTNLSSVKFKLENGDIITFYHISDINCGKFNLLDDLTSNNIKRLKKSPIKFVRLSGTDYYHDFKTVKWNNFFIDKLDCIK